MPRMSESIDEGRGILQSSLKVMRFFVELLVLEEATRVAAVVGPPYPPPGDETLLAPEGPWAVDVQGTLETTQEGGPAAPGRAAR